MNFQPTTIDRPCWHCTHFAGIDGSGTIALCNRPGCSRCRSQPERGCSAFKREVGADDEPNTVPHALYHQQPQQRLGE